MDGKINFDIHYEQGVLPEEAPSVEDSAAEIETAPENEEAAEKTAAKTSENGTMEI